MGLVVKDHSFLQNYADTMSRIISSIYPDVDIGDIKDGVDYSIRKRFKNFDLRIQNNYIRDNFNDEDNSHIKYTTALDMMDYIARRQPIITSYGTMFKRHEDVPNPMAKVIQSFLDLRKKHKKEMFKYPKGSEMFEHYNLLQALD